MRNTTDIDTSKNIASHAKIPNPICPILPAPSQYHTAKIHTLIFLAIESNPSIRTQEGIADEISKITHGRRCYKQKAICMGLRDIQERHLIARNKVWTIRKFEGKYKLIDTGADEEIRNIRDSKLSSIPFDRTTVFRNDPVCPTIFGFKLKPSNISLETAMTSAENYLKDLFYNCYFQMIKQDNTIYILLDCSQKYYGTITSEVKSFIETMYLTRNHK
jgi:hypothetical protein